MKLRVLEHKIWLSPAPISQMGKVGMVETDMVDIWEMSIGQWTWSTGSPFHCSLIQLVLKSTGLPVSVGSPANWRRLRHKYGILVIPSLSS